MKMYKMLKPVYLCCLTALLTCFFALSGNGQHIAYENTLEVILDDGTNIKLFGGNDGNKNNYYYLPPASSLKLGEREDGTPEFLFLKFTTEEREDQGGVQGALMHFLMEWGLTQDQLEDLEQKVKDKTNNQGKVKGPVDLQAEKENSFQIVSAVLTDNQFTPNFVHSGKAPPLPGAKAAVAARLDKNGAQLLAATFEKARSITDVSLALNYEYTVIVNAGKGKYVSDWSMFQHQSEKLAEDYIRKELDGKPEQLQAALDTYNDQKGKMTDECGGIPSAMGDLMLAGMAADEAIGNTSGGGTGGVYEYYVGESQMRSIFDFLMENKVVYLEWEETIPDERLDVIRDAFFQSFLSSFTNEVDLPDMVSSTRLAIDDPDNPIKENAEGVYQFKGCSQLTSIRSSRTEVRLDKLRLPVKRNYQMVGNLASTYDRVKNNRKCVASVNLNDPFFSHRDINFILDLEAQEIFDQEVNYVTVNVRKRRSSANDFQDAVTISKDYLKRKGTLATITYARAEDRNPDVYEYKTQWSLKGGNLWPDRPRWERGDWQGVTLTPPVQPRTIEFEADLEELAEAGFVRATLQVRYQKFGKEIETNIPITVSKNIPLMEQMIFTDRDQAGYAYRLVLTHKKHGKVALDWDSKVNDDYVYATLPEDLKDEESDFFKKAVEIGKTIIKPAPDGTVPVGAQILDKFSDILDILIEENN